MTRWLRRVAPVAFLATGACFATRNDVRLLQADVLTARAEAARTDSVRSAQVAAVAQTLTALQDSLREASVRLGRFQGNTTGDLRSIQEQLLQVQELTGQSQRRINELRAELEQGGTQPTPTNPAIPAAPGDTMARPPIAPAAPGPNQLYQISLDQYRRGGFAAAREGLEELLRLYPTSDLAPDAQFYIGETHGAEKNAPLADSAYSAVVARFPRSPKASTALYKLGLSLDRQGRKVDARRMMERVVRDYPSSDERMLADDWLRGR